MGFLRNALAGLLERGLHHSDSLENRPEACADCAEWGQVSGRATHLRNRETLRVQPRLLRPI